MLFQYDVSDSKYNRVALLEQRRCNNLIDSKIFLSDNCLCMYVNALHKLLQCVNTGKIKSLLDFFISINLLDLLLKLFIYMYIYKYIQMYIYK